MMLLFGINVSITGHIRAGFWFIVGLEFDFVLVCW